MFKVALWRAVGGHWACLRPFYGVLKVATSRVSGRPGVFKVALWRVVGGHRACLMSFYGVLKVVTWHAL